MTITENGFVVMGKRKKVAAMDDNHKYGECPLCHQSRMLTWVLGQVKGSDRLWSGYVCNECLKKAQEHDGGNAG